MVQWLRLRASNAGGMSLIPGQRTINKIPQVTRGFPGGASGTESACQCREHKRRVFDP